MSPGQWRVLLLLVGLLGLDLVLNPEIGSLLGDLKAGNPGSAIGKGATLVAGSPGAGIGWAVGALALLALASVAPSLATWIVVVLFAVVAFSHADQVAGLGNLINGIITQPNQGGNQ